MISVQSAMLVVLGFLAASLLGLLVASAFWSRAVRLTTARIKQSMPVSEPEIKADRDRLRAEYAIKVHKLEMELEQARLARARQVIDINRRDASIATLESDMMHVSADLEEHQNARRVLEQTVADRLPKVEARLAEAKRLLFNRDREIAELAAGAKRSKQALEEAGSLNAQKNAQIERLTTSLTTRGGRGRQSSADGDSDVALRAEIEMLRSKASEQALLIDRLQRPPGSGPALAPPAKSEKDSISERAQREVSEAEAGLNAVRAATAGENDLDNAAFEREARALKAKIEDQAGEIVRLKAALATFEQQDNTSAGGLKDSKIALKARLGSAQAQADQQATTIAKLRGELAAAHERLARQAAQFRVEMRRIGGGSAVAGSMRRQAATSEDNRSLAERVAQVRAGARERTQTRPPAAQNAEPKLLEAPAVATNGHEGNGRPAAEELDAGGAVERTPDNSVVAVPAAAELPNAGEIQGKRRRPRLLERITGLSKS